MDSIKRPITLSPIQIHIAHSTYAIQSFVRGQILRQLVEESPETAIPLLNKVIGYYTNVANRKRVDKHKGVRGATKHRDGSSESEYKALIRLVREARELKEEVLFQNRLGN